mmetsp:Transcript_39739/g.73258  ORF Transcript_39739/g.73258 Transcript_39739/m.73258 type:complete len:83 (-) Transcript_39739:593-841(-)
MNSHPSLSSISFKGEQRNGMIDSGNGFVFGTEAKPNFVGCNSRAQSFPGFQMTGKWHHLIIQRMPPTNFRRIIIPGCAVTPL